jgi:phage terminase small subunit
MGKLTNKQRAFVEAYLTCWNGAEAARQAGYALPYVSAHENLSKPYIQEYISKRLAGAAMSADEVLSRLADQARGDIGDFIGKGGVIDLESAREQGITHLLKSISWTKQGLRIEMQSPQHALELIGKHHGLFVDRKEIDHSGEVRFGFSDNLGDDDE